MSVAQDAFAFICVAFTIVVSITISQLVLYRHARKLIQQGGATYRLPNVYSDGPLPLQPPDPDISTSQASQTVSVSTSTPQMNAIEYLQSLLIRDKLYRKSFCQSAKPTIRFAVIGIELRNFVNILGCIAVASCIAIEYYLMQAEMWENSQFQCSIIVKIFACSYQLFWIWGQIFAAMRIYSFLSNRILTSCFSQNAVKLCKFLNNASFLIATVDLLLIFPVLHVGMLQQTVSSDGLCVSVTPDSLRTIVTLEVIINLVGIVADIVAFSIILYQIKTSVSGICARNSNDKIETVRTSSFCFILSGVYLLIVFGIIANVSSLKSTRATHIAVVTLITSQILVSTISFSFAYKNWSTWMFPYFAMCRKRNERELEVEIDAALELRNVAK